MEKRKRRRSAAFFPNFKVSEIRYASQSLPLSFSLLPSPSLSRIVERERATAILRCTAERGGGESGWREAGEAIPGPHLPLGFRHRRTRPVATVRSASFRRTLLRLSGVCSLLFEGFHRRRLGTLRGFAVLMWSVGAGVCAD
ncbi:hypothetical protein BT93_L1794 [Corymbia citriodora subsp. variegata]|uniref:Uncharacterized protein n=1 Tax=Corymbia citriodora subsp. variegata TaxID=360336 RepID=A0A8T0CQW2_CORYI|nr:hypothetical protein BT93_L1794 [Corymbia citriodora subsp. variegata]